MAEEGLFCTAITPAGRKDHPRRQEIFRRLGWIFVDDSTELLIVTPIKDFAIDSSMTEMYLPEIKVHFPISSLKEVEAFK
jgi:hypothetical protein